jgi:membrane protein CcdC involved in cytochrome C biogenesis
MGLAVPAIGAMGVLVWRLRETQRPLTIKRIIIPPIGMSSGFGMFFYPPTRVPLLWAFIAFILGCTVFAIPLIRTSKLNVMNGQIFLSRSRAFLWVLLGLVAVRLALRGEISFYINAHQTASLFFILAFGMIVHWRIDMYLKFQKLSEGLSTTPRS